MTRYCMECGSDLLCEHPDGAGKVLECALCGELQGDDDQIIAILRRAEALERGIDPRLFGLVCLLENVPGLHVERVEPGDEVRATWPTLFFHLSGQGPGWLTPILKSLTLSGRQTYYRWTIEVQYQHHLVYLLRPRRFLAGDRSGAFDLEKALADLATIEQGFARDQRLSWWRAAFRSRKIT